MDIVTITEYSGEVLAAMNELLPQLSESAQPLTDKQLVDIIQSPSEYLLMAVEDSLFYGTLTLVTFKIPTGIKVWIEDVVVKKNARGKGVGKMLLHRAIDLAKELGATSVNLTSNPSRKAANTLYTNAGFKPRETNTYRFTIEHNRAK